MWHTITADAITSKDFTAKWVKVDPQQRVIGRIGAKDGEFSASRVEVDADGIGKNVFKGWFLNLEAAKAAVDGPAAPAT